MRVTYDEAADVVFIYLREFSPDEVKRTVSSCEANLDFGPHGRLDAVEMWPGSDLVNYFYLEGELTDPEDWIGRETAYRCSVDLHFDAWRRLVWLKVKDAKESLPPTLLAADRITQ
jgi:uncharacterized protein YuzE